MNLYLAMGIIFVGVVSLAIYGMRYRETPPKTRDFPVFHDLSNEVGRVAEEGNAIHIALGSGSLTQEDAMTSVAALQGLSALLDLAATYDTPPHITVADPTLYLLAGDWMRRSYARLGDATLYRSLMVQFVAPTPVTYAAMAATSLFDEPVGSNIILGKFDQEVAFLNDAVLRRGVHSVGGSTSLAGIGAMYPVLPDSKLAIGEDIFAGGTEVIRRSPYWASSLSQDVLRGLLIVGILLAAILSLLGKGG